jgi:hypothetical protein
MSKLLMISTKKQRKVPIQANKLIQLPALVGSFLFLNLNKP